MTSLTREKSHSNNTSGHFYLPLKPCNIWWCGIKTDTTFAGANLCFGVNLVGCALLDFCKLEHGGAATEPGLKNCFGFTPILIIYLFQSSHITQLGILEQFEKNTLQCLLLVLIYFSAIWVLRWWHVLNGNTYRSGEYYSCYLLLAP